MDVFISYNSADRRYADDVKSGLEKNGVSCWIAPECIPGGSDYANAIPGAIEQCEVFVLILTENAQESVHVPRELDIVVNEKKIIIPYMPVKCKLTPAFMYRLTNVQIKDELNTVIADVCSAVGKNTAAESVIEKSAERSADKVEEQGSIADMVDDKNADAAKKEREEESGGKAEKRTKKHGGDGKDKKAVKGKNKKLSKGIKVFILIMAAFACAVIILTAFDMFGFPKIEIAGEKYSVSKTHDIELSGKEISDSDIKSMEKIKSLYSVKFDNCRFAACSPHAELPDSVSALKVVNCDLRELQDCIGDLKDISSLNSLNISGCTGLDDMNLESFFPSGLLSLNISKTGISDISFVQSLTSLTSFAAVGNGITDISKLALLEELTYLDISDNNIESLEGTEYCIKLSEIYAQNNSISSLDPLSNATRLTNVNLKNNKITNISPLAKSAQTLNNVCLDSNNISDMSALVSAENIDSLSFANNAVTSIEFVKNMKNLTQINASNNKITDVSVLTVLPKLNCVFIRSNGVTGSFLITLKGEAPMLDVGDNPITNIHISADSVMEFLNISATDIKNINASGKIGLGTTVAVTYNDMFNFDAINKAATVKIVDCPLDKRVDTEEKLSCKPEFTDIADVTEYSDSLADKVFLSISN